MAAANKSQINNRCIQHSRSHIIHAQNRNKLECDTTHRLTAEVHSPVHIQGQIQEFSLGGAEPPVASRGRATKPT